MAVEGRDPMRDGNTPGIFFGKSTDGPQPPISEGGVVPSGMGVDTSAGSGFKIVLSSSRGKEIINLSMSPSKQGPNIGISSE